MDSETKKKIQLITKFIKNQQYKEGLQEAEILVIKQPKLIEAHLLAGMCYQKLKRLQDAQKQYLQVEQRKPQDIRALRKLCQIYQKTQKLQKETQYLEKLAKLLKGKDQIKYREALVKLVDVYRKDQNLEKISQIFQHYCQTQDTIGDDFVKIATAYFKVGVINKCFNLQKFEVMGFKGEQARKIQKSAKEPFNILLIQVFQYLLAAHKQYKDYGYDNKVISNSLYQMKLSFPEASCLLMLFLLDEFFVAHAGFSSLLLEQIFKLLQSFYDGVQNCYSNIQHTSPEIFSVCMRLGYEYISFFDQFFSLDLSIVPYMQKLGADQEKLLKLKVRQQYEKKINNFILKECRSINRTRQRQNVQKKLQQLKYRLKKLPGTFLEEVVAKMAMNCFTTQKQLQQMKNLLKLRIKNAGTQLQIHQYKYYYDYLIKIAKIYKSLDEELSIYDIIATINVTDPSDLKYQIEAKWLHFSKTIQAQQSKVFALQFINSLQQYIPKLGGIMKSQAIRKKVALKLYIGEENVYDDIMTAITTDRSCENLQCMGVFLYYQKKYKQALRYQKQAFIINPNKYHLNKLIFLTLIKCSEQKQAGEFLLRIYDGFDSIFWVNYILAMKKISEKKFQDAQKYLSRSVQIYLQSISKAYKSTYEKIFQWKNFSYLYMINQNIYHILLDQIILPEQSVQQFYPLCSLSFVQQSGFITKLKLWTQIGQILKILGRTKSAFNYLQEIYNQCQNINFDKQKYSLEICLMKKEFATVLFYMRMFKESESILSEAKNTLDKNNKNTLFDKIHSEINALFFQISIQKLTLMIKFDSHQSVKNFIEKFQVQKPIQPTLTFLKAQYQYYILSYLHSKSNIQRAFKAIDQFLDYFKLDFSNVTKNIFQNRIFQLDYQSRKVVRQSLQDLLVLKYIDQPQAIKQQTVMPLIQLFPQSTIFYIVYGMAVKDLKLKTASFLKCIQIDKESPISSELLASLYLKHKNYVGACKLYLKSLEMDIMNPRCYFGLTVSLFAIVSKSLAKKSQQQLLLVKKCMQKINSYMEYLRCTDPSDSYHILNFYKMIIVENKQSFSKIKFTLESSTRVLDYYMKQSILISFLRDSSSHLTKNNIWAPQQFPNIINTFISTISSDYQLQSQLDLPFHLIKQNQKQITKINTQQLCISQQYFLKKIYIILSQICISLNLSLKHQFNRQFFNEVIIILKKFSGLKITYSDKIIKYKTQIKQYLINYVFLQYQQNNLLVVEKIFPQIQTFKYLVNQMSKIPNFPLKVSKLLLKFPSSQYLNRIKIAYLVTKGIYFQNHHLMNYRTSILNRSHNQIEDLRQRSYLKLIILYRDPNAWAAYLEILWRNTSLRTQQNVKTWLQITNKLIQNCKLQKLCDLKIQLIAFSKHRFNWQPQKLQQKQAKKLQNLLLVFQLYNNPTSVKLKQICTKLSSSNIQFTNMCLAYIINKYEINQKIESILIEAQKTIQPKQLGFIYILQFICCIHRKEQALEKVVKKYEDLQKIIDNSLGIVSQPTIYIMKCMKHLLMRNFQELDRQIIQVCQKIKIVNYSQQVSLNFFEIMRGFYESQTKGNQSGVIQNFMIFISQMIELVKDPLQRGFYLFLRGTIQTLTLSEGQSHFVTDLKKALLLGPKKFTLSSLGLN